MILKMKIVCINRGIAIQIMVNGLDIIISPLKENNKIKVISSAPMLTGVSLCKNCGYEQCDCEEKREEQRLANFIDITTMQSSTTATCSSNTTQTLHAGGSFVVLSEGESIHTLR